jgi:RNA methyltransferase, TrmH family
MTRITSRREPIVAICRNAARQRTKPGGPMLLDGAHLVSEALTLGIRLRFAAFTERARTSEEGARLAAALTERDVPIADVTDSVMEAMSPVSSPAGVIAVADRPAAPLEGALDHPPQLVVAVVDVQEPGNIGAIVRAAEACWATGVVCCGSSADAFGAKALRGSMGSTLRMPVASGVPAIDALTAMRARGLRLIAAVSSGGVRPEAVDLRQPTALLFGGEGPGLTADAVAAADAVVSIPMRAPVESLNVAVAVALLTCEAARQRGLL